VAISSVLCAFREHLAAREQFAPNCVLDIQP
jgi:hypothetical protein